MIGKIMLTFGLVANLVALTAAESCDPDNGGKAKRVALSVYTGDGTHSVGLYRGKIRSEKPGKKCTWELLTRLPGGSYRVEAKGTELQRRVTLSEPATHFKTTGCGKWVRVK